MDRRNHDLEPGCWHATIGHHDPAPECCAARAKVGPTFAAHVERPPLADCGNVQATGAQAINDIRAKMIGSGSPCIAGTFVDHEHGRTGQRFAVDRNQARKPAPRPRIVERNLDFGRAAGLNVHNLALHATRRLHPGHENDHSLRRVTSREDRCTTRRVGGSCEPPTAAR